MALKVYIAGDIFTHKDRLGNLILADAINKKSKGRFNCFLPQNLEQEIVHLEDIRNKCLIEVMQSDLVLVNFDGAELDSGTVVEYMYAKLLDIPCVILRTDFRLGGDSAEGDPWNLMCSYYPRTEISINGGIVWYEDTINNNNIDIIYEKIATEIINKMERALKTPSIIHTDPVKAKEIYKWALNFPGGKLKNIISDEELDKIILRKNEHSAYN